MPYGYDLGDDGAILVPDESEHALIAVVRAWRAADWTRERIADELTARGVPTRTGKSER